MSFVGIFFAGSERAEVELRGESGLEGIEREGPPEELGNHLFGGLATARLQDGFPVATRHLLVQQATGRFLELFKQLVADGLSVHVAVVLGGNEIPVRQNGRLYLFGGLPWDRIESGRDGQTKPGNNLPP